MLSMSSSEERLFSFDYCFEIRFFERISDCLRMNRMWNKIVDKLGSLNCIIYLSRSDSVSYSPLISWRKLRRPASFFVFLVSIYCFIDFRYSCFAKTSYRLNSSTKIALLKEINNIKDFLRRLFFLSRLWQ